MSQAIEVAAAKNEDGKWLAVVGGKAMTFSHYPTKKAALEAARQYAANGVR